MKINKIEVIDAAKPLILHINEDDIAKAGKRDPANCAAAQACLRQLGVAAALVHLGRTYVLLKKKWRRYRTPDDLRIEIISFDRGGSFITGDYKLVPVSPSHRGLGYRQGSIPAKGTGGTYGSHRTRHDVENVRYRMPAQGC